MKTTQISSRRQAFLVTPNDLEELLGIMESLPQKSFRATLVDATMHDDLSLTDVLRLPNAGSRAVRELEFIARGPDTYLSLELRDWSTGDTVRLYASGDEKEVLWRMSQTENWISRTTPWYNRMAVLDFTNFFLGSLLFVVMVAILTIFGIVLWRGLDTPFPDSPKTGKDLLIEVGSSLIAPALFVLGVILNVIRARVFPLAILEFGGGTAKKSSAERWRALFGTGFILSVLASLFAAWLQKYL